MKYALLSVFDKEGIVDLAKSLSDLGYKIISTGGTAKTLLENGVQAVPIQEFTKTPESFDGRMKTISVQIEGGILYDRSNPQHVKQAKELGIEPIDIVVCNLYPFEQKPSIENMDVGGPTMIRAAAKNFRHVLVIIDPKDYNIIIKTLRSNAIGDDQRQELAAKALHHISIYDAVIARHLGREIFPDELTISGRKIKDLRYGENPRQKAALYGTPNNNSPLMKLEKLAGRELSLVNVTDINAGLSMVRMFNKACAVVIKHNNPCGVALGIDSAEALSRAIEADVESAFGGVVVLNSEMSLEAGKQIAQFKDAKHSNIDIIAAVGIEKDALELLTSVRKSMGIYSFGEIPKQSDGAMDLKWVDGGFVWQEADINIENGFKDWKVVTENKPSEQQMAQMQLAWKFITRIKSNAVIVVDKEIPMTRGIGTGQTSRVRATTLALSLAGEHTKGAILASDSFFPFPDSVEEAIKSGISAIVQQGGSVNDQASIDAANKAGIPMVFTKRRAFWH